MLDTQVKDLKIGTMAKGALYRNGVKTVADILERGRKGICAINQIGAKAEHDISRALAELGLQWTIEGVPQDRRLSAKAQELVALVDAASPRRTVANILEAMGYTGLSIIKELRGTR